MYQALYRVWRPQQFDDIVGQEIITRTLKNALITNKISHAYVFTGPRGTGKTSAAKILAKAVNCQNTKNGEPCNECELCKAITEGALGDVIEIDAASNNGVEDIRDIRDKSRYAPTQATYKVYIIDEVHMLSTGAFNALLKTLEEPTKNVLFILATTEPHKIPPTIMSRAQRFDFRRMTAEDIENRLAFVLTQENKAFEPEALALIARAANGGMRDALSLLDQALSYATDSITYETALSVSGSISQQLLMTYVSFLFEHNSQQALDIVHNILENGKEVSRFVEELLLFTRDLIIFNTAPQATHLLKDIAVDNLQKIATSYLYKLIDELSHLQQTIRLSVQQDIYLEVFTMKMSQQTINNQTQEMNDNSADTIKLLQQDIESLKQQINELKNRSGSIVTEPKETIKKAPKTDKPFEPNIAKIFDILVQATVEDKRKIQEDWQDILSSLTVSQRAKLNSSTILAASPEGVVIGFDYEFLCSLTQADDILKSDMSKYSMKLIQHPCRIECIPINQWKDVRQKFVHAKQSGVLEQYLSESIVEKITQQNELTNQTILADEQEQYTTLEEEQLPDIISKATELFGSIVEVEE